MKLATLVGTRTQATRQRIQCTLEATYLKKLMGYLQKLQYDKASAAGEMPSHRWDSIVNEIDLVEALIEIERATETEGEAFNELLCEVCATKGSNFIDQVQTQRALLEYDRVSFREGTDERRQLMLWVQLLTAILNYESGRKIPSSNPRPFSVG